MDENEPRPPLPAQLLPVDPACHGLGSYTDRQTAFGLSTRCILERHTRLAHLWRKYITDPGIRPRVADALANQDISPKERAYALPFRAALLLRCLACHPLQPRQRLERKPGRIYGARVHAIMLVDGHRLHRRPFLFWAALPALVFHIDLPGFSHFSQYAHLAGIRQGILMALLHHLFGGTAVQLIDEVAFITATRLMKIRSRLR